MAEEPTLPRLPAISWDADTETFSNTRKRARSTRHSGPPSLATSSDPAVFSSDDDPALDNYAASGRKKKKRYVGSWFQQQPTHSSDSAIGDETPTQSIVMPKQKRTLRRQLDSGVWLGSDGAESSDSDLMSDIVSWQSSQTMRSSQTTTSSIIPRPPVVSVREQAARREIQRCIDTGDESVGLSHLGLESISNATISPLCGFACIPIVEEDVPFEQRDPSLKIFLSNNSLTRVPGAIFDITSLTVLSLRDNDLTELPPAISQLRNLETLNISQNSLRYLPSELLELLRPNGKIKDLLIHPNPFYAPENMSQFQWGNWEYEKLTFGTEQPRAPSMEKIMASAGSVTAPAAPNSHGHSTNLAARSPVQFSDTVGNTFSKFRIPPPPEEGEADAAAPSSLAVENFWQLELPSHVPYLSKSAASAAAATAVGAARVPTLMELALQASTHAGLAGHVDLAALLPEGTPAYLPRLLRRAAAAAEAGGQACCVCGRGFAVARAQWLEWREVWKLMPLMTLSRSQRDGDELLVPFIRRGCSWRCIPGVAPMPPAKEYEEREPFEP